MIFVRLIVNKRNSQFFLISLTFKMAASENGCTDLLYDLDLEQTCDTGYEKDVDVKMIDGFYDAILNQDEHDKIKDVRCRR